MEKITINTENLINGIDNAVITVNGIQELMDEIKEITTDKELSTDRMKYIAILGAVEIFKQKFDYKEINTKEPVKQQGFKIAIKPLLKYINDYCNPHTTVIVTSTGAELLSGEISINNFDFVKD